MNSKQRLASILAGKPTDRIGKAEAPWPMTRARWHKEGIPAGMHANDYFQMDLRRMIRTDTSFLLPSETVKETDEFIFTRNSDGVLVKGWKDEHATPHPVEYPIKSLEDWRKFRDRLVPDEQRYSFGYYGDYGFEYLCAPLGEIKAAVETCASVRETFMPLSVLEPYEGTMCRVGDENLLMWMATEPEFVREMFTAHAELAIKSVELLLRSGIKPDCVFCGGDIAYKNGMLFSPKMYRELLLPLHTKMFRFFHDCGLNIIYHSDGRVTEALPLLIEAGIDCIEPLEVQAGNDMDKFAEPFGKKVSFMGHMSVVALSGTKDEAVAEARRCIRAGQRTRGFILHSDHSLPDTVSLANYQAVMEVFDKEARS
jgi:uroporphyrinogen decarboxylase